MARIPDVFEMLGAAAPKVERKVTAMTKQDRNLVALRAKALAEKNEISIEQAKRTAIQEWLGGKL